MIDKSRLGPFVLEQRLGRQTSGNVYHAVHLERRRAMALRIMTQYMGHSGMGIQEFAREVAFLKTLEHPHVVRVYGGGIFDEEAYIAMELIQGESLEEILATSGRLPWQTVVEYAAQACQGLEYAHQRGAIHQNLSPAKLLLTTDGRIKITDFRGNRLNQYDRWDAQPHLTSVTYMAPEQLRGEQNVTQKADLYALGCILFEMLTGRPPFEASTAHAMREQHLQTPPPRLSTLVFDCPIWLDVLVAQMLEKDANKRPHYASSVSVALQEVKQHAQRGIVGHAMSAPTSALRPQAQDTAIKRLLRRKTSSKRKDHWVPVYERAWFLAGCAALVVALCTWAFWPASEEQLFAEAEVLMASNERTQWQTARDKYLVPLLEKYPNGSHAPQARQYLERIELKSAQTRVELNLRLGRRGKTAGERRYAEAWALEQDGELPEALAAYQEAIAKVDAQGEDASFVKLAQQRVDELKPAVALATAAEQQNAAISPREPDPAPTLPGDIQPEDSSPLHATPTAASPGSAPPLDRDL